MKRVLALTLALLVLVTAAGFAQTTPGREQMLILPLALDLESPEDFDGVNARDFYAALESAAEAKGSKFDLVIPDPKDPRLAGVDLSVEPDPATAVALGQKFGVPLVGWAKAQFRLQSKTQAFQDATVPGQQMQAGDPAPQNLITVGGLAHIGAVDVASGKVLVQGPLAVFRSDATRANQGTDNFDDDVKNVTHECAQDLATRIVEFAQKRRATP